MSLQSLLEFHLQPPATPFEALRANDWVVIQERIGSELPFDYKRFIESYGTGRIDQFLTVFNPLASNKFSNLFFQYQVQIDVLRELNDSGLEIVPYDFFPIDGGVLPFGMTDNGDVLYWVTVGQADNWKVAVNAARSSDWERFPYGMAEFLWKVLTRKISSTIFPDDFPSGSPTFVSSFPAI